MKILCIIPVYNAELFIVPVIEAIQNQLYKNIEIVVVDDGSTDASHLLASQAGVEVIKLPNNIGKFMAINEVLKIKRKFNAFYIHDADDISYRNHFLDLVTPMIENKRILLSFCNYRRVNYFTGEASSIIKGTQCSMALYKKEVLDTIGYFDNTRFGGDTEYWRRFLLYFSEKNIYHVDKCLANCFVHKKNLTIEYNAAQRRQYIQKFSQSHELLTKKLKNHDH